MNRVRCSAIVSLSAALVGLPPCDAFAQAYPTKVIRMIVPYPAGGTTDIIARPIAQRLSQTLGQQVIVDNRAGAGGTLGADVAAKAPADGYTVFVGAVHHTIATSLYKKLPYRFERDFTPLTVTAFVPNVVIVHPSVPATSVKELIELAKAKKGQLNFGSAGSGTTHHLSGELFKSMAGVDILHVPYKGGAPMMNDLLGGQVSLAFETQPSALPHIKAGKVRALAVTTAKRSSALPDVPTVAEAGLPGYEATTWYGLLVRSGTPKEIVARLYGETIKALETPELKERLTQLGAQPGGITQEEFAALIKADTEKWAKVVKESGATVE
jgi:tripartite-type tricarboxylate transporter receptor subunit TctC